MKSSEESLKERPLEGPKLGCILKKWDGRVWTQFIWLRICTSGVLL
jgi:hypothetical protein